MYLRLFHQIYEQNKTDARTRSRLTSTYKAQNLSKFVSDETERKKQMAHRKAAWSHVEAACQLTTVMSSLSNHCSLSSARGHMSGLRADFIRLTQRRDSSSPGDPATLLASFTCQGKSVTLCLGSVNRKLLKGEEAARPVSISGNTTHVATVQKIQLRYR